MYYLHYLNMFGIYLSKIQIILMLADPVRRSAHLFQQPKRENASSFCVLFCLKFRAVPDTDRPDIRLLRKTECLKTGLDGYLISGFFLLFLKNIIQIPFKLFSFFGSNSQLCFYVVIYFLAYYCMHIRWDFCSYLISGIPDIRF